MPFINCEMKQDGNFSSGTLSSSLPRLMIVPRGIGVNMVAVAIPIAITIFVTDILKSLKHRDWEESDINRKSI